MLKLPKIVRRKCRFGGGQIAGKRGGLLFGLCIRRLRSRIRRRTRLINLRFKISRFLNQNGSELRIADFLGELEQRPRLTRAIALADLYAMPQRTETARRTQGLVPLEMFKSLLSVPRGRCSGRRYIPLTLLR